MNDHIVHIANGRLQADTRYEKVRDIVSTAAGSGHVVLHFHGGLVSQARGREIANDLIPVYAETGAYPVFFVWEAGLLETIQNNLREIAGETVFRVILKRVLRIVRRKQGQSGDERAANLLRSVDMSEEEERLDRFLDEVAAGRTPPEPMLPGVASEGGLSRLTEPEELVLKNELASDIALTETVGRVSNSLRRPDDIAAEAASRSATTVQGATETLMDPDSLDRLVERPAPDARGVISIARFAAAVILVASRVIRRRLGGRDHGLHATIVEEVLREFYLANIGGRIWTLMKGDTRDSFGGDPHVHGGTAVLQILNELIENGREFNITLVGHSTGAVFIGHLLRKAAEIRPAGFGFQVVFLAPAATFELMETELLSHATQISGLRIFTMTDANEKADALVPGLYPHSLLYFVSGVVEDETDMPILGMARFHDAAAFPPAGFPGVETVRLALAQIANAVVWSVTEGADGGLNSASRKHGDFDNDPTTLDSVKHIIRDGF